MNMKIYEATRHVPPEAKKPIPAGRLKGYTNINPMWRIKTMTEQFGICGIGWRVEITKQWLEPSENGEVSAFCNINLFIKVDGEWSEAIPSLPTRGAWIEIICNLHFSICKIVAPHTGSVD